MRKPGLAIILVTTLFAWRSVGATPSKLCTQLTSDAVEIETKTTAEIEIAVNQSRRVLHRQFNFASQTGINSAIKVREIKSLTRAGGHLLPFVKPGEMLIVRKGRAEGFLDLRRMLTRKQERAWIYIPTLGIWVYDTFGAGSNYVQTSLVNGSILSFAFGAIELFHTHTQAGVQRIYQEYKKIFDEHQISESQILPLAAIPSMGDVEGFYRMFHLGMDFIQRATGHIVSPMGIVSYRIQIFTSGPMIIAPARAESFEGNLPLLASPKSPNEIVKAMLAETTARSIRSVEHLRRTYKWPEEQGPRLVFEFEEWK